MSSIDIAQKTRLDKFVYSPTTVEEILHHLISLATCYRLSPNLHLYDYTLTESSSLLHV